MVNIKKPMRKKFIHVDSIEEDDTVLKFTTGEEQTNNLLDKGGEEQVLKEQVLKEPVLTVEPIETNDLISEFTLEYLMNKKQYLKYLTVKEPEIKNKKKREKQFYKKRVWEACKILLLDKEEGKEYSKDVQEGFDIFLTNCISYFKMIDKRDILQSEYNGMDLDQDQDQGFDQGLDQCLDQETMESLDQKFLYNNDKKQVTMDNFVIRTSTVPVSVKRQMPLKKKVNLKDPVLKNKGIGKKNNIHNTYEQGETCEQKEKKVTI